MRISLKTQKLIFERFSRGIIRPSTKEKPITLKNCLGSTYKKIDNDGWDFLIAVQPQDKEKNVKLSFGIGSFETVKKFIIPAKDDETRDDQIKVRIKNIEWDYFYANPVFFSEYTDSKKKVIDDQYLRHKKNLCNKLLNGNDIFLKRSV